MASLPALQRFDSSDPAVSITHAVLQLLLAVSHAHMKAVGASSGLGAVSAVAVKWAPVFDLTPVDQLLPFVRGLLLPPGGAALAQMFSTHICGSLGRVLLAQGSDGQPDPQQQELTRQTLGLLVDCCQQLQPNPVIGSSLPLLMTAQPGGLQSSAYVRQLAGSWSKHSSSSAGSKFDLLSVWAGLQLLPYACDRAADAVAACQAVVEAMGSTSSMSPINTTTAAAVQDAQGSTPVNVDLLQLRAAASSMLAQLLPQVAADRLPEAAAAALELAQRHPLHLATVEAATQLLTALRSTLTGSTLTAQAEQSARDLLSHARLAEVSTAVMPALLARSQSIRAAALQLLTAFDQPPYVVAPVVAEVPGLTKSGTGQTSGQTPAFTGVRCEVLTVLRDMHCQPCSLEAGRSWSAALGRIEGHLEYGRLPVDLVPTVVAALVGVCYIR